MIEHKLDLLPFLKRLESLFARQKSYELNGDKNVIFKSIAELDNIPFQAPEPLNNLDSALMRLKKLATLRLEEIFEFVKIIRYFVYLKSHPTISELNTTGAWLAKINIPQPLQDILEYFDEKGELKNGVFEDFDALRHSLAIQQKNINDELKKILHSEKIQPFLVDSQIHFINQTQCLLLKAGFQNAIKGIILDRSQGGFFYLLPESIRQIYTKSDELRNLVEIELLKICANLSAIFHKQILFLQFINNEFDKFDHIQARIEFAKQNNLEFLLPSHKNQSIILKDFCHPILENPKPINLTFDKQLLLITGVNAGGKTMLLKSILSACFLSKHLIPFKINAELSSLPHYKHLEAIISDPQNSKNDISTFAGRMLDFSKILNQKEMLLGVDEIELGTDADEAASLYKVLLESLLDHGAKLIITTHHKRLAALMANDQRIMLAAALYDEHAQKPLFEFLYGSIGKSYAFETAARYNIPYPLIERAKKSYGEDKERLNLLIEKSAQLEIELKNQILLHKQKNEELEKKIRRLDEERQANTEAFNKQKQELQKTYDSALKELRVELKNMPNVHRAINNANTILQKTKQTPPPPTPKVLKIGDRVKYGQNRGVILNISDNQNTKICLIELESGMRLKVDSSHIKPVGKDVPKSAKTKAPILPHTSKVHLDLHGLRAEEAREKLDKFLSDSLLAGFDEVLVFHGMGSGILARMVKEFLREHPRVVSFEDAPPNMGGFGAKLIRL